MNSLSFQRLLREWVALLAILAMLLGPLSLAVSRGLSAQERVNIAAGLSALPICSPSDIKGGQTSKSAILCDHCLPTADGDAKALTKQSSPLVFAGLLNPLEMVSATPLKTNGLPPATGPPHLI